MKKILLILVGGTICTALNENNTLSVTAEAGAMLKAGFENSGSLYTDRVQIDLTENLFISGYGMDNNNVDRNLRYISYVDN